MRIDERVPHPGLCREVNDRPDRLFRKELGDALTIGQVHLDEVKPLVREELGQSGLLQPHIVVVVDIVETNDVVPSVKETLGRMESDKAGRAGQ